MGFYKEVTPRVPTYMAFQYDGTQQSIDDLATALDDQAVTYAPERVDATTWRYNYMGSPVDVDITEMIVLTFPYGGGVSISYKFNATQFENNYQDA